MQSTNILWAVLPRGCRSPKCHHASALQLTSKNRDSSANVADPQLWFDTEQGNRMSGTDESKPAAKGRRSKKVEARGPKSYSIASPAPVQMQTGEREPVQVPQADPQQAVSEPVEAVVAEA